MTLDLTMPSLGYTLNLTKVSVSYAFASKVILSPKVESNTSPCSRTTGAGQLNKTSTITSEKKKEKYFDITIVNILHQQVQIKIFKLTCGCKTSAVYLFINIEKWWGEGLNVAK